MDTSLEACCGSAPAHQHLIKPVDPKVPLSELAVTM
jgi:hypothetical protein